MNSEIRDPELWQDGEIKIDWVKANMPLLRSIEKEFSETKPFAGVKVALSVHLEAKTAYLCKVLAAGGAEMYVTGSNPLSTQDDVAAALVHDGLNVFAWYGATDEESSKQALTLSSMTAATLFTLSTLNTRTKLPMLSAAVRRPQRALSVLSQWTRQRNSNSRWFL